MKNPLDYWQRNETDQETLEKFFESDAGHRFILAMQQMNLPSPTLSHDNQLGFQRCIDSIPLLFRTAFKDIIKQEAALKRIEERNRFRSTEPK